MHRIVNIHCRVVLLERQAYHYLHFAVELIRFFASIIASVIRYWKKWSPIVLSFLP
mgnify:CR=1 FL=1